MLLGLKSNLDRLPFHFGMFSRTFPDSYSRCHAGNHRGNSHNGSFVSCDISMLTKLG